MNCAYGNSHFIAQPIIIREKKVQEKGAYFYENQF